MIRSPADVFFYSGKGTKAGCLSFAGECWVEPDLFVTSWRSLSIPKVLIIGAPHVLQMNTGSVVSGGLGAKWVNLLRSKGGPVAAILGYQDDAPNIGDVGQDIATQMGTKLAAGLNDDELVPTWLKINGDQPGKNTWNAVGIDAKGYWWIEEKSMWERSKDWPVRFPWRSGDKYDIIGPATIV
jgi:hypothetical protein